MAAFQNKIRAMIDANLLVAGIGWPRFPYEVLHHALAAIAAQVDFLVTQDKDFTDRDKTTEKLHRQLTIILPGTFLREYMGWSGRELEAIRDHTWQDIPSFS